MGIYQQPSVMCPTGKVHVKNSYKDFISFKSSELWLRWVIIAKALSTSPFTIFVIALLITDQTQCVAHSVVACTVFFSLFK